MRVPVVRKRKTEKRRKMERRGRALRPGLLGRRLAVVAARGGALRAREGRLAGWAECSPVRSEAGFPFIIIFLKTVFFFLF
jgi:hypothetical protein